MSSMRPRSIRAAIFLGAGASCFAKVPAVQSFFECVKWSPPARGFEAACQRIVRTQLGDAPAKMSEWPRVDAEAVFGHLELLEKLGSINDTPPAIPLGSNMTGPVLVRDLISHLRGETVRIYGADGYRVNLQSAPHHRLFEWLDGINPPRKPLYVFTTNYDRIIEHYVELVNPGRFQPCSGFTQAQPGRWSPELFESKPTGTKRKVTVIKLHGSVTWKRGSDGFPVETGWEGPTEHDCLLYFGYKSVPEVEPFATLHNILKSAVVQCDLFVVIGFRFGDPYIRELFDFGLQANKRLRVVFSLTRPPESDSPIARMTKRFPDRMQLLANHEGQAVPFGGEEFQDSLQRLVEFTTT